jgi:solute carrier family 35 (adenosine 3'-phospho 5'-phosphosulfate transporter), member B2
MSKLEKLERGENLGLSQSSKAETKICGLGQRTAKLLFCFIGLQVSYIAWGVTQEQLMTQEYSVGKFKSAAFCVFGNRFLALFIALGIVLYRRSTIPKGQHKDAPFYWYAPSSVSNTLSSFAQYEALKYVSFPTQVLSKSCKLIPVMIVGMLLNKKTYPRAEYVDAVLITIGVALFTASEKLGSNKHMDDAREDSMFGVSLLALYLFADSFTSQWQSRVYKDYQVDQYQMMLGVNIWSMLFTGASLVYSGEGVESFIFIMSDSAAFWHMLILSVTSATGQLFIFYTIKEFGPVVFTIMMTTRQIFSLVISFLLFSKEPMQLFGWIGATLVFLIVFNRIRRNTSGGEKKVKGGSRG